MTAALLLVGLALAEPPEGSLYPAEVDPPVSVAADLIEEGADGVAVLEEAPDLEPLEDEPQGLYWWLTDQPIRIGRHVVPHPHAEEFALLLVGGVLDILSTIALLLLGWAGYRRNHGLSLSPSGLVSDVAKVAKGALLRRRDAGAELDAMLPPDWVASERLQEMVRKAVADEAQRIVNAAEINRARTDEQNAILRDALEGEIGALLAEIRGALAMQTPGSDQ